jgi:hypothetical protein
MSIIDGFLERISFHNEENDCSISSGDNEQTPEEVEI